MTLWQPGMRVTAARLNAGVTPTVVTTGATAGSGFTLGSFSGYRMGDLCSIFVVCGVVTGVTATSGNINDITMATLPTGYTPLDLINATYGNGSMDGECTISNAGVISLRSANANIAAGTNVRVFATFIASTS